MANLTTEQHIDFFIAQARAQLEDKARAAVAGAMMPCVKVPIAQAVEMMTAAGRDPGRFDMRLQTKIEFVVGVSFEAKV